MLPIFHLFLQVAVSLVVGEVTIQLNDPRLTMLPGVVSSYIVGTPVTFTLTIQTSNNHDMAVHLSYGDGTNHTFMTSIISQVDENSNVTQRLQVRNMLWEKTMTFYIAQ